MFQKSTLTLIFLRFTFIHIQVVLYFLFSILRLIEYNIFHKHTLCQQHEAISHYHISHYKFYLTFRDYCGINLLLRHQYGSHYLAISKPKKLVILRTCQDRQVQGERTHPDIGLLTTGFNRSVADLFRLARNWLCSWLWAQTVSLGNHYFRQNKRTCSSSL
jgi:hypothetical protein